VGVVEHAPVTGSVLRPTARTSRAHVPVISRSAHFRRILFLLAVPFAAVIAFSAAASAATTVNPANAPTGTHVQTGTPGCAVNSSLNVNCNSFQLAGVGNTNARADLSATYSANVVCINGGQNPSDSQHQGAFTASASTGQLSPKNGKLTVPSLSATAPTEEQFLAQQTCPNPNWTPTIPGGHHALELHLYGVIRGLRRAVHHDHGPLTSQ